MWKKYFEGRVDDSIPNKEWCFTLGWTHQDTPGIWGWKGGCGAPFCFSPWIILCFWKSENIRREFLFIQEKLRLIWVCQGWAGMEKVFTFLAGVVLETWKNGGKMIINVSLPLLSTHFHSLQFFIFLFASMALSCWGNAELLNQVKSLFRFCSLAKKGF